MSHEATRWAWTQECKSHAKLVLLALADCVNAEAGDMTCWPSVAHLTSVTGQDRKTVMDNLGRLRLAGLIVATGEHRGATGQIAVYRLNSAKSGTVRTTPPAASAAPSTPALAVDNSTKDGTVAVIETVPVFTPNSTNLPVKQYQIPAETVPKLGHGTGKESGIGTGKESGKSASAPSIPGVPTELLGDWLVVRKAKKAGALTATIVAGLLREAAKAGITPTEAVTCCCEAGWQGFRADWYAKRIGLTLAANGRRLNPQEALEESNRAVLARFLAKDEHAPH